MRLRAALLLLMLLALSAGCADDDDATDGSSSAAGGGGPAGGMGTNPNPPGGSSMPSMSTSGSMSSSSPPGATAEIDLLDDTFAPLELNITVGTNVTFLNEGMHSHTVTIHHVGDAIDVWVKDSTIASGQQTQYTFAAGGTYHVWCRFHGAMTTGMHMVVNVVQNA